MAGSLAVPVRRARVTLRDPEGASHTVEVTASALYEAAALALAAFRQEGWLTEDLPAATVLEITVLPPPVQHRVTLAAVERWMASASKGPRQQLVKASTARRGSTQ